MENLQINKKYLVYIIAFVIVLAIGFSFKHSDYSNSRDNQTENTISFSGHGEVNAVPDIANISFSIVKEAKTVKD